MNKKLEKSLVEYGLTMTDKNTAYGVKKGYEISVSYAALDPATPVRIHVACYATALQRTAIENAMNNRTDIIGEKKMTEFGLTLGLNDWTAGRMASRFASIMDWILGMLNINGALGVDYCPHCGKPIGGNAKKCNVAGATVTLDEECMAIANSYIDTQNQQFKQKPNNVLKGFLGALIGGIVGGLTVVLFYMIGFVSAVSGIVAVALGAFLYTKFGGKPNKVMILIVTITSLACLVLAVVLTYIVAASIAMSELGFNMSPLDAFASVMEFEEVSRAFYADLALVILFAVVGIGIYTWSLWRKIKTNGNQQHITAKPYDGEQQNANTNANVNSNIDPFEEVSTSGVHKDTIANPPATENNDTSENQ